MSDFDPNDPNLGSMAILCEHVANGAPILLCSRGESIRDEDSGWQFMCNRAPEENPDRAKIWLLREVIEQEPSLLDYLLLPPGSVVSRETPASPWKIHGSAPSEDT